MPVYAANTVAIEHASVLITARCLCANGPGTANDPSFSLRDRTRLPTTPKQLHDTSFRLSLVKRGHYCIAGLSRGCRLSFGPVRVRNHFQVRSIR